MTSRTRFHVSEPITGALPMLNRLLTFPVVLLLLVPSVGRAEDNQPAKVRVLLLGDSTVIGTVCRELRPKADQLEDVVRKLLAAETDLPPVEVVDRGVNG